MDNRYVALWLDTPSQEHLKKSGVTKLPHLTIMFDDTGILSKIPLEYTIPLYTPQEHVIHTIETWVHNDKKFVVALMENEPFLPMVQHLEMQGAYSPLGFKAHITLWKGTTAETPPSDFTTLVGTTIGFDKFGFEDCAYDLFSSNTFELY